MFLLVPVGDRKFRRRPAWGNLLLVVACVAVWVYMAFSLDESSRRAFLDDYAIRPARWTLPQLFTSLFLHAGLAHLAMNMLFLWIVGDDVEHRLGHIPYLAFFLLCGTAGGVMHLATVRGTAVEEIPTVGASGAIAGVMGAYMLLCPRQRIRFFYLILIFPGFVEVGAFWAIGAWFLGQWIAFQSQEAASSLIAYGAHVGGFLFGAMAGLVARMFLPGVPPRERLPS